MASETTLAGSYNYWLVGISIVIAVVASYTALDLSARIAAAQGRIRWVWLLGGAIAMGTGIWSMHYVGMLAFRLPIPVLYYAPAVLLSLVVAILASAVGLYVVTKKNADLPSLIAASPVMGAGIAAMHYIGMSAMRLQAMCEYSRPLFALSILSAVLISFVALWLALHLRDQESGFRSRKRKIAGAVLMGSAIPVMHYTGMAAVTFHPWGAMGNLSWAMDISALSTAAIISVTFMVLFLALATSSIDRRFSV